ncbi:group 1 glycosyl transferase [Cylindrospermum sp. NIES-4074]|nr:group 1 glycosyl transferase [Cylindrospermum sp. NIES-4074]
MKIFLYLKHFPPYGDQLNEGTIKAVHGLATGLVNSGTQVTVLCESSTSNEESYRTESGYEIKCFVNLNASSRSFKISTGLQRYVRNYLDNTSIVILNGMFHSSVYSLSRILKKHGVPYIVAPHDPYSPAIFSKNAFPKLIYWYFLERNMLKQAKAVQVLDARHGKLLNQLRVNTPILAIPNGFSPKDVYPEMSLEWPQDGTAQLFFLGRLDAYNKGIDLLLDAFAQIANIEDTQLTIQGPDWGDKKSLQAQATKLSITEKVSFLHPDYDKSPSLIIQKYDVFCIPSRFEGFSLAALEAMLAGRVLLVSEIAGIVPYVENSGCGVVVAAEVSAIKLGLIKLLKRRSEWKDMGLAGRNYALKHLQWDKIASTALKQYQQLVK